MPTVLVVGEVTDVLSLLVADITRCLQRLDRIREFVSNAAANRYMGTRIYDDEDKDLDGWDEEVDGSTENVGVG